jgi:hypothetical protein
MARKRQNPQTVNRVKMTVPIDRMLHARLSALAALLGRDKGDLAETLIREGLRGKIRVSHKTGLAVANDDDSVASSSQEESAA